MSDLTFWLKSLGLEKYQDALERDDIDLAVVPDLTDGDLEKLGLSLGHRRKFLAAAQSCGPRPQHCRQPPRQQATNLSPLRQRKVSPRLWRSDAK